MHRIIVAGGRQFADYGLLKERLDFYLHKMEAGKIEIVSGGARGADSLGERYAREKGHRLTIMRADWDRHGRGAGYRRNEEMAEYADALIAFWDGSSRGTGHMIKFASDRGLQVRTVRY